MEFADTDMLVTRGVPYERDFRFTRGGVPVNWNLWAVAVEARTIEGYLALDMTPFLTIDGPDPTLMRLKLSTVAIKQLPKETRWDLLLRLKTDANQAERLPARPGRILVRPGVTDG